MIFGNSWRRIKRRAGYVYFERKARKLRPETSDHQRGRILVAGLLSSPNGIGRGGRLVRDGLLGLGYDVSSLDLSPIIQPDNSIIPQPETPLDDGKGPIILHVNPTEVPKSLYILRNRNVENRRLIGVWAWELERVPQVFTKIAELFDEVWSISQFSKESFASLPVPVTNIKYPIAISDIPITTDWRDRLNVAQDFLVLTTFDSRSSLSRKNPRGAVDAFLQAFEKTPNARLIIKANGELSADDKALFAAPNIHVIEKTLTEDEMTDLIKSCDCYLSLTRAEGFGLVGAEAASYGIATIITGWSSPAEWGDCPCVYLVDYDLIPTKDEHKVYDDMEGRRWAEPDIAHAAALLQRVAQQDLTERQVLASQSIEWWQTHYGLEAFENCLSNASRLLMSKTQGS